MEVALIWRQVKLGATECELTTRARMTLPIIRHLGFPVANLLLPPTISAIQFILRQILRRNTVILTST